jgi:hypothetical protein
MALSHRRLLVLVFLLAAVALISSGSFRAAPVVHAAAGTLPTWDALSAFDTSPNPGLVFMPPAVLAGTNSHSLPANAAKRNGYCLDVNVSGVTPAGVPSSDLGFTLVAHDPILPATPATHQVLLTEGLAPAVLSGYLVQSPAPAGPAVSVSGTVVTPADSSDDVYCVVAYAEPGYKKLTISWNYTDSTGTHVIALTPDIDIRTVTLVKKGDGLIGAPAEVCTSGWDPEFMTGSFTNTNSNAAPDPVDDVRTQDWVLNPVLGTLTVPSLRRDGVEWCALIDSTIAASNVQVTLNFDVVYNRATEGGATPRRLANADDQRPAPPSVSGVNIVNSVELRHILADGSPTPRQQSEQLVVGTTHFVCLIGSDIGDTLSPAGVSITSLAGPDIATVANLNIFHKTAGDTRVAGVSDGTLCLRWTSLAPGEQTVNVQFSDNGTSKGAFWDTNGDGNGLSTGPGGPMVTRWNKIDVTQLGTGNSPDSNIVTFQTVTVPLTFNVANGTFLGSYDVTEFVIGSHRTNNQTFSGLVDGAKLQARLLGTCGYFLVPNNSAPTTINGVSVGGRFELNDGSDDPLAPAFGDTDASPDNLQFSTNGSGCTIGSTVRLEVDVYYPGQATPAKATEYVTLNFSFIRPSKIARLAWAGDVVNTTYAFASNQTCAGEQVHFVRAKGQPGSFLAAPGVTLLGPDHAVSDFGSNCSLTVPYESEDPGEVDIEVFIDGNPFSKVAFPIYYMLFEDVQMTATPDSVVSTVGDVTGQVRGYFVGSNPSGRPQETKADGRTVPANRWVIPDDLDKLIGDLRSGNPGMPPATVVFQLENEGVVNSYKGGVKNGGAGWLVPDDSTDYSFNLNPVTRRATILGSAGRPRTMSQPSDSTGSASLDTFGDFNLSFEGCAANVGTGNPLCKPDDIVGRTRYFATVDYPQNRKFLPVNSNTQETIWRWAGYKQVTVVNTDSPQIKYVVVHLRDRDGFCDGVDFNNVLGNLVRFEIDAGGGKIIEAQDQPSTISGNKRFASATTFDTIDNLGNFVNLSISQPVIAPDECQAWIKVTNSLLQPMNVIVTIPAPPAQIPGDIRVTGLQCIGTETITVTNKGTNDVNLAGYSLQSPGSTVGRIEHLDLFGLLRPGQSATFHGGPGATSEGWLNANNLIFGGPSDGAALVWNGFALSAAVCDGTFINPPLPGSLPGEGEGEIVLDIVVPFGAETATPLVEGWNLVTAGQATTLIAGAIAGHEDDVLSIYAWDPTLEIWRRYIPDAPSTTQTIDTFGNGYIYWVQVKRGFTLTLPL